MNYNTSSYIITLLSEDPAIQGQPSAVTQAFQVGTDIFP